MARFVRIDMVGCGNRYFLIQEYTEFGAKRNGCPSIPGSQGLDLPKNILTMLRIYHDILFEGALCSTFNNVTYGLRMLLGKLAKHKLV